MVKRLKLLAVSSLVLGLSLATAATAFASTPATVPVFVSATYDVGTGSLALTGTNLVPSTITNLAKVNITDGKENSYTLTTKQISSHDIVTGTTVTSISTLNAVDQAALAKFLDNSGTSNSATKALNGGTYQVNVYSGWDGATSTTDVRAHALTVSGVVGLTSATYDLGKGQLVITGTNMVANSSSLLKTDISPKYLTITDGATHSYTLTTNAIVKVANGASASITLNATDQLALQSVFTQAGATSFTGSKYNLTAAYGWNGTTGLASMGDCGITVTDFEIPVSTISPAIVAAGSTGGATKVTATAGTGNTLAYEFSSSTIATPNLGTSETIATNSTPLADSIYAYTSGSNITGVGPTTNKYLGIYELNGSNVVKFKLFTLTAANIKALSISAASVNGNTLTLTTTTLNAAIVPANSAFTVKIGSMADVVKGVAISGDSVTLTLTTAAKATDTVTVAYTKPLLSYLQDSKGNAVNSLIGSALKVGNITGTPVNPTPTSGIGFTYTAVPDLNGNTVVNVTVTAQNVTGVQVKGVAANYISASSIWRATLPGTVTLSAADITLTTSAPIGTGFTYTTVPDLNGNTVVNVTVTAQNVTGVQVKGVAANYISASSIWRAILPGTVTLSAADITLTTSALGVVAIDTTKTVAIKGTFGDALIKVYLLSGITPVSVISVTSDGTTLPYISTVGAYQKDIMYTGTVPASVSVVLTTANGSQTVIVPVSVN